MPSKHPRIAITADPVLGDALERVRAVTGTHEPDSILLRRLALKGAEVELRGARDRAAAVDALFNAVDDCGFDGDLDAIDRLNTPWLSDPAA